MDFDKNFPAICPHWICQPFSSELSAVKCNFIIIIRQDWLPFLSVETTFVSVKSAKSWITTTFCLKVKSRGHVIQRLIKIGYFLFQLLTLTHVSSAFKIFFLKEKKKKSIRFKSFRRLHEFVLHHKSAETAENPIYC